MAPVESLGLTAGVRKPHVRPESGLADDLAARHRPQAIAADKGQPEKRGGARLLTKPLERGRGIARLLLLKMRQAT